MPAQDECATGSLAGAHSRQRQVPVLIVTGHLPEQWVGGSASVGEKPPETPVPCREVAGLVARLPPSERKPTPIWGVELVGGPTDETALAVHHGLGRGTMGWAHVRVGAEDRASAQKLWRICVALA